MIVHNRNNATWQDLTDFTYRGIKNTLSLIDESINFTGKSLIENVVFIIDENNRIRQEQLSDIIQLSNDQISNEKIIIDSKADTQRTVIAIKIATNDYINTIEQYANEVKMLIAEAKELAQVMSENEVTLTEQRKVLAEEKASIKIQSIDLEIRLESIKKQHVEIEKLRAQLDVAKANTKLIMAEIDVKKAELATINAEVQKAMAEIDKINLTIEVSMVLADLIVKQIAGVRLDAERADINAIAQSMEIKLNATLTLMDRKLSSIQEKIGNEETLLESIKNLQVAKLDEMVVWLDQAISDGLVQDYKELSSEDFLKILKDSDAIITEWSNKFIESSGENQCKLYVQQASEAELADEATIYNYKHQSNDVRVTKRLDQKIKRD